MARGCGGGLHSVLMVHITRADRQGPNAGRADGRRSQRCTSGAPRERRPANGKRAALRPTTAAHLGPELAGCTPPTPPRECE